MTSFTKTQNSNTLKVLQHIFARPILAALIVGSLIHLGKLVNFMIHSVNYYDNLHQLLKTGIIFTLIDISLPFLIPLLVVSLSRKLSTIKEQEFLNNFPDSNPDLIIKCNKDGEPVFINTTVKALLFEQNIPIRKTHLLIPEELKSTTHENRKLPSQLIHFINDIKIEYFVNVSHSNELFLSGRLLNRESSNSC